jgi:hypothetical protein
MNKDKQAKLEGERFFGEGRGGRPAFGFQSQRSNEDTALPGIFGVESMPFLKNSEGEIKRWMEQNSRHKSKSEATIQDELGFL